MTSKQLRNQAWEVLRKDYWMLFLGVLVFTISTSVLGPFSVFLIGTASVGLNLFFINVSKGSEPKIGDIVIPFTDRFGNAFTATILKNVFLFLWTMLFIIPGLIKQYSYAMTEYIVAADKDIGGTRSYY